MEPLWNLAWLTLATVVSAAVAFPITVPLAVYLFWSFVAFEPSHPMSRRQAVIFGCLPLFVPAAAILVCAAISMGNERWIDHEAGELLIQGLLFGSLVLGAVQSCRWSYVPVACAALLGFYFACLAYFAVRLHVDIFSEWSH